jgi:riboflavin synthase
MGGHFVTGHVDTVGRIATLARQGSFLEMEFEIDPGLSHHVVEKGSVAVDGVSLTVASCKPGRFRVSLVPATLAATTLGNKKEGQTVNIETDILGKYVAAFLAGPGAKRTASDDSLRKALHESGFLG